MTDIVELGMDSDPLIAGVNRAISSLEFLEAKLDKLSRTGTRNISKLNKDVSGSLGELTRAMTQGLASIEQLIIHQEEAATLKMASLRAGLAETKKIKDAEKLIASQEAAMWDAVALSRKATEEGKTLLLEVNAAKRAAIQTSELAGAKLIAAQEDAMWAKHEASEKARAEGRVLLAQLNASRASAAVAASVAAEKAMLGTASHYGGVLHGMPMEVSTVAALNKELAKTASHVEKTKRPVEDLSRGFKQLALDGNDVHSAMRGLASGFGLLWLTWGNLLPLFAGAALSQGFVQAIKVGAKVAENLSVIEHVGGATTQEMIALDKALVDMGRNTQFGPVAVSDALKVLSLAGLNAKQSLEALKPVLQFSIVGEMPTAKAAESLIAISTAFGYTAKDLSVVGDVIAKTAAISMASTDGMTDSFRAASVVAQQYGVDLNDAALNLAFLSQIGIKGSAAGTAMKNMYTELMSGSKKAQVALRELNVTTLDLTTGAVRPLTDIIGELDVALAKKSATAQQAYLRDLANNRGSKDLVAALQAYRSKVYETNSELTTQITLLHAQGKAEEAKRLQQELSLTTYQKFKREMQDAPGFVALAGAERSLSPAQQFEAIKATLSTSLYEAFKQIQDSLFILGNTLKTLFSSPEFTSSVTLAAELVTKFTSALVNNIGAIVKGVEAFLIYKAAMVGFAAASALPTISAMAAGLEVLAIKTLMVATSFRAITASLGVVGAVLAAAGAAWLLFADHQETASEKAKKAHDANILRNTDLTKSLDDTIKAYEARTEARRKGTTVEEELLSRDIAAGSARIKLIHSETQAQIANEIATLSATQAKAGPQGNAGPFFRKAIDEAKARLALDKEREDYEQQALQVKINLVKQYASAEKAAADIAAKGRRDRPIGSGDRPEKTLLGLLKQNGDEELRTIVAQADEEARVIKKQYDNQMSMLGSLHTNKLISEGAFQAKELAATLAYEQEVTALRLTEREKFLTANVATELKVEEALSSAKGPERERLLADLKKLDDQWTEFAQKNTDQGIELKGAALKRLTNTVQASFKEVYTITEQFDKFWRDDAIEQTAAYEKKSRALDEYTRVAQDAATIATSKYAKELGNLTVRATEADVAFTQLFLGLMEDNLLDSSEGGAMLAAAKKKLDTLNSLIDTFRDKAEKGTVAAANNAVEKLQEESLSKLVTGLANSVETALFEGGAKGAQSLVKLLEEEFLRKPFRIMLQGVMGGIVGGVSGGVGSSVGSSFMGSALGSYTAGAGSLGSLLGSSSMGALNMEIAGVSIGLQGLATALPYVGAALLALKAIGDATSGEQRSGGQYGYSFNGSNVLNNRRGTLTAASGIGTTYLEGPSGGDIMKNQVRGAIDATVAGIATTLKSLGSTATLIGFQAGYETSGDNRGGVLAGGTLSTGRRFGQSGAGDNYSGTLYDPSKGFNMTAQEASTAFALELQQSVIEALQAAGDLPKAIDQMLRDVNGNYITATELTAEQATNITNSINEIVTTVNQLRAALISLPFESLKTLTFDMASTLIQASGGVDKLSTNLSNYYDNFFSSSEKTANLTSQVSKAFAELHLPMLDLTKTSAETRASFRSLVDTAMKDTSESGLKTTAALLNLSSSVAELTPAAAAAATAIDLVKAKEDQTVKILGLLGKTQDALARTRATELASLDVSLKAGQSYIYALEDEAALKDKLKTSYEATSTAMQSMIDALKGSLSTLQNYRTSLQLGANSPLTPYQKYLAAKQSMQDISTVASSTGVGDAEVKARTDAISKLPQVAGDFLDASRAIYASGSQYTADYTMVKKYIDDLTATVSGQISTAQTEFDNIKRSTEYLFSISTGVDSLSVTLEKYLTSVAATESALLAYTAAPVVVSNIDTTASNADIVAAIDSLKAEVASLRADQGQQTGDLIAASYDSTARSAETLAKATVTASESSNWKLRTEVVLD